MEYFPYQCDNCGANLGESGAVIVWDLPPEKLVGRIEPGNKGDQSVIVVVEWSDRAPEISLQCWNCGAELDYVVEEMYVGPEYSEGED